MIIELEFGVNSKMWELINRGIESDLILGDQNEAANLHQEYHKKREDEREREELNNMLNKKYQESLHGLG